MCFCGGGHGVPGIEPGIAIDEPVNSIFYFAAGFVVELRELGIFGLFCNARRVIRPMRPNPLIAIFILFILS